MATIIFWVSIAVVVGLYVRFGLGVGATRLESVSYVAADQNVPGLHLFGSRSAPGESGPGRVSVWHLFIRASDGAPFRELVLEHSGETASGRSGYTDGFSSIEADIWKPARYSTTVAALAARTKLDLEVDRDNAKPVRLDSGEKVTLDRGPHRFEVTYEENGGYAVACRGDGVTWSTKV